MDKLIYFKFKPQPSLQAYKIKLVIFVARLVCSLYVCA